MRLFIRLPVLFLGSCVLGLCALALVAVMPVPAGAAPQRSNNPPTEFALGQWLLGDAANTQVVVSAHSASSSLTPTNMKISSPSGVDVSVAQRFCDVAADVLVQRFYNGSADLPVSITSSLGAASVSGAVPLSGEQLRAPDCANPQFDLAQVDQINGGTVDLTASWRATGPLTVDQFRERVTRADGSQLYVHRLFQVRSSTATAVVRDSAPGLDFGSLGSTDSATLARSDNFESFVGGCFLGGHWPKCDPIP